MTHTELYKMLKTTDLPVAYRYFKEPPTPPYIVYLETDGAGWGSDARNEIRRTGYLVELYSTKKEIDVQSRLETLFDDRGINYDVIEGFIETEKLYRVAFAVEFTAKIRR